MESTINIPVGPLHSVVYLKTGIKQGYVISMYYNITAFYILFAKSNWQ